MSRRVLRASAIAVALGIETAIAYGVPAVQRWEGRVPRSLPDVLLRPEGVELARHVTDWADPWRFALVAVATLGVGWWRLGGVGAARGAALLLGATATTQVLQELLVRPRDLGFGPRELAFPSGHMTGATAVAFAAGSVLRLGPTGTTALVAVVGVAMAAALLAQGTHVPSDLLAGLLVSAGWSVVSDAGDQGRRSSREARKPSRARVARNHHRAR